MDQGPGKEGIQGWGKGLKEEGSALNKRWDTQSQTRGDGSEGGREVSFARAGGAQGKS